MSENDNGELPAGWNVMEQWMPMTYHHELMYQVYVWGKRPVKAHWWSRAKPRIGWHPYGDPFVDWAGAVDFARRSDAAMRMMP